MFYFIPCFLITFITALIYSYCFIDDEYSTHLTVSSHSELLSKEMKAFSDMCHSDKIIEKTISEFNQEYYDANFKLSKEEFNGSILVDYMASTPVVDVYYSSTHTQYIDIIANLHVENVVEYCNSSFNFYKNDLFISELANGYEKCLSKRPQFLIGLPLCGFSFSLLFYIMFDKSYKNWRFDEEDI